MTVQILNPLTLPLFGERLIEASAGTGKTYTIAALYLRLLLGLGDDAAFTRRLQVNEILVVTFTDAATAELRDRIRARIRGARIFIMQLVQEPLIATRLLQEIHHTDPLLAGIIDSLTDWPEAANILLSAERQMDEAAVYTIHGFCQRMLTQNAFESGALFEQTFLTDESALIQQVVLDFWRRNFYPLPLDMANVISQTWATPEALKHEVSRYLSGPMPKIKRQESDTDLVVRHQKIMALITELKSAWREVAPDIEAHIADSGIPKNRYRKDWVAKWVAELTTWALQLTDNYTHPDCLVRFKQSTLLDLTSKGVAPTLPIFSQIDAFCEHSLTLRDLVINSAVYEMRLAMQQQKLMRAELSFDDLLSHLSSALKNDSLGLLGDAIRQRYPLAMIDEFQDTDPQQYHIFHTLYGGREDTGLLMIGDPKQAIYAFRGADIFTYIEARRNVSAHYTLQTNWRSSHSMVNAVNRLFSHAINPFLFEQDIPFLDVAASPDAAERQFWLQGEVQPAMQLCCLGGDRVNNSDYQQQMAEACANSIASWLQAGIEGRALLGKTGKLRPVVAKDIAVLVRTGREAALIRQALSMRGVASVYLSNRESVFSSQEARDLLRVLQACLLPGQERLLRAGLATPLLGLTAADLDLLNGDEWRWEMAVAEFEEYRQKWLKHGVLPMLRQLIQQRKLAENLLAGSEGERRLTNLLHVGELLQEAAAEQESEHALLRWLARQIDQPQRGGDDPQLRLESDQNLVQIVTIHKSKGLEYPLVWLPFACSFRAAKGDFYHDESLSAVLDLTGSEEAKGRAERERLAEDVRLIYVALTRAVYQCQIGIAPLSAGRGKSENSKNKETDLHLSALGYLLQQGQAGDASLLEMACATLANQDIALTAPNMEAISTLSSVKAPQNTLVVREFQGRIERNWWVTSYSNLSRHQDASEWLPRFDHDAAGEQLQPLGSSDNARDTKSIASSDNTEQAAFSHSDSTDLAEYPSEPHLQNADLGTDNSAENIAEAAEFVEEAIPAEPILSPFTFPRGARPGTFLHSLFETLDFANQQEWPQQLQTLLEMEGLDLAWQPVLHDWVSKVLETPLNASRQQHEIEHCAVINCQSDLATAPPVLRLSAIARHARCVELEFHLPIRTPLQAKKLDTLCRRYDALSRQAAHRLNFAEVQGILKGYIDLVFSHQGKFYVLDYKSNYLGDTAEHYHQQAMTCAMIEHRYDLQYQLYTLALHRYLQLRLKDYDYDRHIGGVYYLFLRGMNGYDPKYGVYAQRPEKALIMELDQLFSGDKDATIADAVEGVQA
ncbi:MAG: exodeoxyribonuclease V subunit beta [Plesiomonas sp.]|uniref:exodeoxyribonuclease V subunit beta n=1 Tax=Plesiomonas sp. TaxID=2486279 RepID=UPI003F2E0682